MVILEFIRLKIEIGVWIVVNEFVINFNLFKVVIYGLWFRFFKSGKKKIVLILYFW